MSNRLYPDEIELMRSTRLWFKSRTVENYRRMVKAIKDYIKAALQRENEGALGR